jgi:hypothetical protein
MDWLWTYRVAERLLGLSLPFMFALVIQLMRPAVRDYADRCVSSVIPPTMRLNESQRGYLVSIAVYTYAQLGFVISVLTATVSCIALTLSHNVTLVAALAAFGGTSVVFVWILRWQGMDAKALAGARGRGVRILGWAVVVVMWCLTC